MIVILVAVKIRKYNNLAFPLLFFDCFPLDITITPDDASNEKIIWTSSASDFASITQSGLATISSRIA